MTDKEKTIELLEAFITWYNAKPQAKKGTLIYVSDIAEFLKPTKHRFVAGALETLTNKENTFLGYDHLNKIKKEAEEWKERYTNDH